jgi:hypothetical protein
MSTPGDLGSAALAEIDGLHRFFAEWFLGTCPNEPANFARCAEALAPAFVQIDPAGRERPRAALLESLRSAHGCYAGLAFAIGIERPQVRLVRAGLALATYNERQQFGARGSLRRSSALLAADKAAPRGVVWLHLHETWMLERP